MYGYCVFISHNSNTNEPRPCLVLIASPSHRYLGVCICGCVCVAQHARGLTRIAVHRSGDCGRQYISTLTRTRTTSLTVIACSRRWPWWRCWWADRRGDSEVEGIFRSWVVSQPACDVRTRAPANTHTHTYTLLNCRGSSFRLVCMQNGARATSGWLLAIFLHFAFRDLAL